MRNVAFVVKPLAPFRLDLTAWALRRRSSNVMDRWENQTYKRVLVIEGNPIEVAVQQEGGIDNARLKVSATGLQLTGNVKSHVTSLLEKCLGIRKNLSEFYQFSEKDNKLRVLVQRFKGLKPPRFPTVFEAVLNGIACQQISLTLGILLLNQLTSTYGLSVKIDGATVHAFPRPEDLASLSPEDFRRLGFSHQKGQAIIELANNITNGHEDLERLESLDDDAALKQLRQIRGVGRWTAEYVLLRGLGQLHIFPADDVGGRRSLQHWLKLNKLLNYEEVNHLLSKWKPYGGLIYFHLLMNRLVEEGHLHE